MGFDNFYSSNVIVCSESAEDHKIHFNQCFKSQMFCEYYVYLYYLQLL